MTLEVAVLDVKPGQTAAFEAAFAQACPIIARMAGYRGHELQRCLEQPNRYLLLVKWDKLEDRRFPPIGRLSGMEAVAAPFL